MNIRKMAQAIYDSTPYYDADAAGPRKRKAPARNRQIRTIPEAYPDYGRSLVSQRRGDPETAGGIRGLAYGAVGAILAAAAAKVMERRNTEVALAALVGGLAGGVPGYYSGRNEQESLNTKMLFLRRMGIDNPGELEAAQQYPGLSYRLTEKGTKI